MKDFPQHIFEKFSPQKQLKKLYELARLIEKNQYPLDSSPFKKLKKYHQFLQPSSAELIQKINKEFNKITALDYQFQIYLMLLERFIGQSSKEYDFLIKRGDESIEPKKLQIVCLLDSVRSAHNVGAMLRNAECFGVRKVLLTGLTPAADHPQVIKTAMSTNELLEVEYHKNPLPCIASYKQQGYQVIAMETGKKSAPLSEYQLKDDKILILFGHEQFGLSLELLTQADHCLHVPLFGSKNSLNVSVCQGIVLQHFASKILETLVRT